MTSPIRFTPGISAEVRDAIEPHLDRWAFLIPTWCHEVNVTWCDSSDLGAALGVTVHYEYRRADVNIYPNFLSCPERRERNVIHELLHIVTAPMWNTSVDLKNTLVKAHPEMEKWAEEMVRHSYESVTCDLTHLALTVQSATRDRALGLSIERAS